MAKKKEHPGDPDYPGKETNKDLINQSPQTEESKRLSEGESHSAIERKDVDPEDHGKTRGGNHSGNQI